VVFPQLASPDTFKYPDDTLSSSSAFLQSITQPNLVSGPQPANPSHGLPSPFSTFGTEGPLTAGFACPLRSAFRVWIPSWRFPPFGTSPALFHAGSAPGICPSELSPFARYPAVTDRKHPPTVSPQVELTAEAANRPPWLRFLGIDPCENPSRPGVGLAHRPLDAPLGFALLGFALGSLGRDFAPPPLSRFATETVTHNSARRPRVSIGSRLVLLTPSHAGM